MAGQSKDTSLTGAINPHEHAIASRKSMYQRARLERAQAKGIRKGKYFLNIELSDVWIIQHEVWLRFFEEASLPRTVEIDYEAILSSRTMPDPYVHDSLTLILTRQYASAISRAVAQLADWIVTAAISRAGTIRVTARFREAIWRYCLEFAAQLGQWDPFVTWVDKVVRIKWHPTKQDGSHDLEQIKSAAERSRPFFEKRIEIYWREWLGAIDRGIELRRALSSGHSTKAGEEGELKAVIRIVKEKHPEFTQRELAGMVDDIFSSRFKRPTPILKSWKMPGVTRLVEAFDKPETKNRVKKYISEVT